MIRLKSRWRQIALATVLLSGWNGGEAVLFGPGSALAQNSAEKSAAQAWTDSDTKLANQYIHLLEAKPEYGRVLDLLWDLYEKKGAKPLLLEYFKGLSAQPGAWTAKLLYGHLLRKDGQLDAARGVYGEIVSYQADNRIALRGLAEVLEQDKKPETAADWYGKLVAALQPGDPERRGVLLKQAALFQQLGRLDDAVTIWETLLQDNPADTAQRKELIALLLEAGKTEKAIGHLKALVSQEEGEARIAALEELARLYEFVNDFDNAAEALRQGMVTLHFQHHWHARFFTHLVRLHERFNRLPELEERLTGPASTDVPTERAVYLLAEFYRLTAAPSREEPWVRKLVELLPNEASYSLRLVELYIENDKYEEAARSLDDLLANEPEPPLQLILLRARVALNTEDKKAAVSVLENYLNHGVHSEETLKRVLAFSREHYLDTIVEQLLRGSLATPATSDESRVPIELARFLQERGRLKEAQDAIDNYVAQAGDSPTLRAVRLGEAAELLRDMRLFDASREALAEAMKLEPDNLKFRTAVAETLIDEGKVDEAAEIFDKVWAETPTFKDRADIDQRIFSLLRGIIEEPEAPKDPFSPVLPNRPPDSLEDFRKMAQVASQAMGIATDPPSKKLLAFYDRIKETAKEEPTPAHKFRAAWWAFKLVDYRETYQQLAELDQIDPPIVEVERLLLDLAEQTENTGLLNRQLEKLVEFDADNKADYLRRWAEIRMSRGYEDEAIGTLEDLVNQPDASLATLRSLATAYELQGRNEDQINVWRRAYERGNVFEKRQIVRQLTSTLVELGETEEALRVQLDLIENETDIIQKRKQLENQLSLASRHYLLPWMEKRYTELAQEKPLDRFFPEALSKIHRAMGDLDAAFLAMKKAYYMSGNDLALLSELGELAGQSEDLKAAIYYRRQLIALDESKTDIESWKALIEMLELDLRAGEADLVRERLESKFTQDADFLKGLATSYYGAGRATDARRVLQRLADLRPWDAGSLLELGLLQKETGQSEEAFRSFTRAIEATEGEGGGELVDVLFSVPVIDGGWYSGAGPRPIRNGLELFVQGLEEYRLLDQDLQSTLVAWFRAPRPEFNRVPQDKSLVRLRAIEEAAEISRGNGEGSASAWAQGWLNTSAESLTERLWAAYHGGLYDETQRIIREQAGNEHRLRDLLLYALLTLRMGQEETLVSWMEAPEDELDQANRHLVAVLSIFLLAREDDGGLENVDCEKILTHLQLPETASSNLVTNLAQDGRLESALQLGRALSNTQDTAGPGFYYYLARIADWLNEDAAYRKWLEKTVSLLLDEPRSSLTHVYYPAVAELYYAKESDTEKAALIATQRRKLEEIYPPTSEIRLEAETSLSLIEDDIDQARQHIEALVGTWSRDLNTIPSAIQGRFAEIDYWARMSQFIDEAARRAPLQDSSRVLPGEPYLSSVVLPRSERAGLEYFQFNLSRMIWELENLSQPQREWRVKRFMVTLPEPELGLEVASSLEAHSFFREAISIYRSLIFQTPEDFTFVRGFFTACREAGEYQPALDLINRYYSGELTRSSGMTLAYLSEMQALFLKQSGDRQALMELAQSGPGKKLALLPDEPVTSREELTHEFRRALVDTYLQADDVEGALRVLEDLRDRKETSRADHLTAAKLLIDRDRWKEAQGWLEEIEFDQSDQFIETMAVTQLSNVYSRPEIDDKEGLERLGRVSLKYSDPELTITVGTRLFAAGRYASGDGCLLLHARKAANPAERARLLATLIGLRLQYQPDPVLVKSYLETFFGGLEPGFDAADEWVNLAGKYPDAVRGPWRDMRSGLLDRKETRLVARLTDAQLDGGWDVLVNEALQWPGVTRAEWELLVEALTAAEHPALALRLLETPKVKANSLFGMDAEKQLQVLTALDAKTRIAELHVRLVAEAYAEGFHRRYSVDTVPNFHSRQSLPRAFASAGLLDQAHALYGAYYRSLPRVSREHTDFLEDYAQFLIGQKYFEEAEVVLSRAFRKSLGLNPSLLVDLYDAWGRLNYLDRELAKYFLPSADQRRAMELRRQRMNSRAANASAAGDGQVASEPLVLVR